MPVRKNYLARAVMHVPITSRACSISTESPHPEERTQCASRRVGNDKAGCPPFETHRCAMLLRVRLCGSTTSESALPALHCRLTIVIRLCPPTPPSRCCRTYRSYSLCHAFQI